MSIARRAAIEAPEVTVATSSPRRGRTNGFGPTLRRGLAPTAIVGLLAITTTLTFVPMGSGDSASVADPLAAHDSRVANRASREFVRVPAPDFSTSPSRPVADLPSASPAASALPSPAASPSPAAPVSPLASASPLAPVSPAAGTPSPSSSTPGATSAAPAPDASPAAAAPAVATPEVDWSIEGKDVGPRWVTDSVNVRTGPGTGHDVLTTLAQGREVTITDSEYDGWHQVSLKGGVGWVKATFLTETEPAATTEDSPSTSPSSSSSSSGKSPGVVSAAGSCPRPGGSGNGMTSRTVGVLRKVCAQFPGISSYGGYRAGSSGYHGSGQAIDAMISGDAGLEVARWARENASSLGVVEVIYQQRIWTSQRSGDGWRSMSSRGSASANHFDHVHISVG